MGLFNKKKEETNSCCCVGNCTPKTMAKTEASKSGVGVKVLGSGCVKCKTLENATREALVELGMDTTIDHVTDFSQIAAYGVMTTPALVVDGKVVSYGKVLPKKEAKTIIADARRQRCAFLSVSLAFQKSHSPGRIEIAQGDENHRNTQHLKITPVSPASVQL